jgi:hypothetical protein
MLSERRPQQPACSGQEAQSAVVVVPPAPLMPAVERLRTIAAAVTSASTHPDGDDSQPQYLMPDARQAIPYAEPRLLSDAQVAEFLAVGFLSLPVNDVDPGIHARLHAQSQRSWRLSGGEGGAGLGNNVWPALPDLGPVLRSATVHGACTSLLGAHYTMSAHRHMHDSSRQGDQTYHKDTQRWPVLVHRPRTIYMFYVPAGATLSMGPTAVIPGSHLMSVDRADWSGLHDGSDLSSLFPGAVEHKLTAPAHSGVAVLLHHSLFHRGTARLCPESPAEPWRPMFKFVSQTAAPHNALAAMQPPKPSVESRGPGGPSRTRLAAARAAAGGDTAALGQLAVLCCADRPPCC